MRFVRPLFLAVIAALSLLAVAGARVAPAGAVSSDLFFSEYVEGSSNNKAVEIYNGTGAAIPLAAGNYQVRSFHNGGTGANTTVTLTGTVAAGDVYVLAHVSADPAIIAQADQTTNVNWFNGNDAVVLSKGPSSAVVDSIGQIGFDPGTEWGSGLVSTADNTLRRKAVIEAGDTNATDAFDPALQWDGFALNTFGGLGAHTVDANDAVTVNCGDPITVDQGTGASRQVSASDADGRVTSIALTSAPTGVTLSNVVPATATGGTATADVTIPGTLAVGSHDIVVTATNDDTTPQSGTCTLRVNVAAPPLPIYELQGTGHTSPYAGTQQRTTGVVTVLLGSGFFMQDASGDGNPATSDGMFVFVSSAITRSLSPGDRVAVSGTVVEFRQSSRPRDLGLTEFSPATVTKLGSGGVPAATTISDRPNTVLWPTGADEFERHEGMLVSIPGAKVVAPTNDFGELSVVASGDHASTTPNGNLIVRPLAMDMVDYNPERIMVDDESRQPGGTGTGVRFNSPQVAVTVGDTATGPVIGALDYQFSNYRIQTNHALSAVLTGSPAPTGNVANVPSTDPFEARVASFNVENLFDCVNDPAKDDTASCNAAALAALETKLTKLARAFEQELGSPEIAIVEETENSLVLNGDADGEVPGTNIQALLPRLSGNWAAASFDASDVRSIEVAFIYDTDRVSLNDVYLSTTKLPDNGLFSGDADTRPGREPLVGHFTLDDLDLIVVGNHFKSKGGPQFGIDPFEAGDDPLYGAFQPPTRWTELQARHAQADYVRDLVDLLLAGEPDAGILVGGDLNDFAFGEPGEGAHTIARIAQSATAPLHNLVDDVPADEAYSFIFEGNSQVLDHMLVNGVLGSRVRGQGFAHFNIDYPDSFGLDPATVTHVSDHDPLFADLCSDLTAPTLSVSVSPNRLWPPNHKYRTVKATVSAADNADPMPAVELVSVTSDEPDDGTGDGDTADDIVIVNATTFMLRSERSGSGDGRVYTITYRATDACGNSVTKNATVTVPLDN